MYRNLLIACVLLMTTGLAHASSVFTEANLERLAGLWETLDELEARYPETAQIEVSFENHCDWQAHYRSLRSQEPGLEGFWAEAESLLRREGLTPAQYTELTFKFQWPILFEGQDNLAMFSEMLSSMPEEQRAMMEPMLEQFNQMYAVLDRCMTREEKALAMRLYSEGSPIYQQMLDEGDW